MKQVKKRYYIIHRGHKVGETWAVSPEKAANNYWWKYHKECDPYKYTDYKPSDFDVMEAHR